MISNYLEKHDYPNIDTTLNITNNTYTDNICLCCNNVINHVLHISSGNFIFSHKHNCTFVRKDNN